MFNFLWPTDTTRITSEFGHRWGGIHPGLDIAESGYHPIYATADGVVTRSYKSSSYGECIFILHSVDGQTYESVYAHMRIGSRKVYKHDRVKQGDIIGIMGNTGHSTGQHLHFELHKGRWNYSKSNAIKPLDHLEEGFSMPVIEGLLERIEELEKRVNNQEKDPSEWAEEHWKKAVEAGYFDGTRPKGFITRQESATVLNRLIENNDLK